MILLKRTEGMRYTPDLDKWCNATTKLGLYFDMEERQAFYFVTKENSHFYEGFMRDFLPRDIRISISDPEFGSTFTLEIEENCKPMHYNLLDIKYLKLKWRDCAFSKENCPNRPCFRHYKDYKEPELRPKPII